jgi:GT2 family glycosyltransferase
MVMARKKLNKNSIPRVAASFPPRRQESYPSVVKLPQRPMGEPLLAESPLEKLGRQFEDSLDGPSVSAVIVNRNGVDLLRHGLFALKTQTYPLTEIILVDNGSSDDSVDFVRTHYPFVKILESGEDMGYDMGVNLGAKCAKGDLVAILGNNMIPTPDWLKRLVAEFQKRWPGVSVVSSWKPSNQKLDQYTFLNREINFVGRRIECDSAGEEVCFAPEGSAFIYARYLNLEGPFDPEFQAGQDDIYFGWKTRLTGKGVSTATDARIFQKEIPTSNLPPRWKRIYYENRNCWMSLLIFYDRSHLIRIFPWLILDVFFRILEGLVTSLSGLLGVLTAVGWIVFHPARIYLKRKLVQKKRKVPDDKIIRFMSGKIIGEKSKMAGLLNFLSLMYCRLSGLKVKENGPNKV